MAVSFAGDIRSLFRDTPDVDTMKRMGIDLSSYEDVKSKAEVIYARLEDGRMPCKSLGPRSKCRYSNVGSMKAWHREC